jgi:hypothetical protein
MNAVVVLKCGGVLVSTASNSTRAGTTAGADVTVHVSGFCVVTGGTTAIATFVYSDLASSLVLTSSRNGTVSGNASMMYYFRVA